MLVHGGAGGEATRSSTRCRCPSSPGLLYAQTGWGLHPVVDRPLQLLGDAFGPVALVLVGVTLAQAAIGRAAAGARW